MNAYVVRISFTSGPFYLIWLKSHLRMSILSHTFKSIFTRQLYTLIHEHLNLHVYTVFIDSQGWWVKCVIHNSAEFHEHACLVPCKPEIYTTSWCLPINALWPVRLISMYLLSNWKLRYSTYKESIYTVTELLFSRQRKLVITLTGHPVHFYGNEKMPFSAEINFFHGFAGTDFLD